LPPQSIPEAKGAGAGPPLRLAASLILISPQPVLRVLWVHRSEANPFLGGFHSFPGGRMSPEDGPTDGEEALELAMLRCAVRETFEETGIFVGVHGPKPDRPAQRALREQVLNGNAEFWPSVERIGLSLDRTAFRMSGRWVTPHFSRARFDTMFFVSELGQSEAPDVWPGELSSGEWIEPDRALKLWEEDRVTLAMPTLYAIRVIAEGAHDLSARLRAVPEANAVPSRHVILHPGIVMVPLRTETLAPATHTNAAVIGDGEVVVIDPGTADPSELQSLYEVVDAATAGGGKVAAVLLTHRHLDHVSGAEAVRGRYGAPVWGHPLVSDRVRLDRELKDGDPIDLTGSHPRRVLALHTPGHSRSHLAFFEERSRTLCAGDLVSTLGTVVVDPPDGNMGDYMRSLERIKELKAAVLIPGHGPPSRGVDHLLAALLEHRRNREARILKSLEAGPMTEELLCEEVYRDTPGAPPALAARTLEAHLERLAEEGRIRRETGRVMLAT
jgi:glyoxylase-like metal-dependent hydrolase (beta-lactamase superfamily II)/8-oxo-dGTP pyrophosphatase MutT (NUDIX family)